MRCWWERSLPKDPGRFFRQTLPPKRLQAAPEIGRGCAVQSSGKSGVLNASGTGENSSQRLSNGLEGRFFGLLRNKVDDRSLQAHSVSLAKNLFRSLQRACISTGRFSVIQHSSVHAKTALGRLLEQESRASSPSYSACARRPTPGGTTLRAQPLEPHRRQGNKLIFAAYLRAILPFNELVQIH